MFSPRSLMKDLLAGVIVFLVALPLCLGIALASNAPLFSGLIAGIVGGIVVGTLSGSHTSVTGPAAGLTAIVATQIANLGSFEAFLLAVVVGGILQILLGIFRAGALSAFFPSSVIKGLLAAIGVILVIKQLPYLLGHVQESAASGEAREPVHQNIFSEIGQIFSGEIHAGALAIGLISLAILIIWDRLKFLKNSLVPAPLVVVVLGVVLAQLFAKLNPELVIGAQRMVTVPVASNLSQFLGFLTFPDFTQVLNPAIYVAAITIAVVASLETLLNLDAVDNLDKKQRVSPPSRELLAQGAGNIAAGMVGGIPVTSVVIRGSVNVNAGAESKASAIFHGLLLLIMVGFLPSMLNVIPLSCLAAVLVMTGFKLASPSLFRQMWEDGRYQFLPFMLTLVSIVITDLLIGIIIGMVISLIFILASNLRRPIRKIYEKHIGGDVLHIELANQVSFLNRAALEQALREAPPKSRILLDARRTDYIDPDILSLIREFMRATAPVYGIEVQLVGFREDYRIAEAAETVDFISQERRERLTPAEVQQVLIEGNLRFTEGHPLDRAIRNDGNVERSVDGQIAGSPSRTMAAIFTGIGSRTPVELIFDLDLGDAFVIRVPGNVVGPRVIGGLEFACLDGAKLIVVMGHTVSRLVTHAIEHLMSESNAETLTGCQNLESVLAEISKSTDPAEVSQWVAGNGRIDDEFTNMVARRHILRTIRQITEQSSRIEHLVNSGAVRIVGAVYDMHTGIVEFLDQESDDIINVGSSKDVEL